MNENIIEVKDLKKYFKIKKEKDKYVKAIDGISFNIRKGETLGLVGESGSGKSTTAYSIMGLHSITDGSIIFRDNDISMNAKLRKNSIKKEIQIVFQDPGTTLNPKRSIKKILKLPLEVHKIVSSKALNSHIEKLLDMVDLPPYFMYKNPPTLGGGERQLIAIARALATDPSVIVLDEPTSALDVSIQAKIINKLIELQKEFDFSYLFITHDMSLMRNISDRVAIMYLGKIMELAPTKDFFEKPLHPYTQMLISSIPVVSEEEEKLKPKKIKPEGEIPSPVDLPKGCRFSSRCSKAFDKCFEVEPEMKKIDKEHEVLCHLY